MDGVTASDDREGDLTSKIVAEGNVDITKEGDYIITYTVSDNSGNEETVSRVVIVKKMGDSNEEEDNDKVDPDKDNDNNDNNNDDSTNSNDDYISGDKTEDTNKDKSNNKLPQTGNESVISLGALALSLIIAGLALGKKKVLRFKSK